MAITSVYCCRIVSKALEELRLRFGPSWSWLTTSFLAGDITIRELDVYGTLEIIAHTGACVHIKRLMFQKLFKKSI
jgi:hypothetical protein